MSLLEGGKGGLTAEADVDEGPGREETGSRASLWPQPEAQHVVYHVITLGSFTPCFPGLIRHYSFHSCIRSEPTLRGRHWVGEKTRFLPSKNLFFYGAERPLGYEGV